MIKKIITGIFIILFITTISAQDFNLEIKEHYYNNGKEVIIYGNESYDGISFDLIGKNNLDTRILKISITNATPNIFLDALPDEQVDLRIKQEKVLFGSKVIDIENLYGKEVNFSIYVIGLNEEKNEPVNANITRLIIFPRQNKNIFLEIGESISPSQPFLGLIIFFGICLFLIFMIWYKSIFTKIDNWRKNKQKGDNYLNYK
jgi:hypothetical protein